MDIWSGYPNWDRFLVCSKTSCGWIAYFMLDWKILDVVVIVRCHIMEWYCWNGAECVVHVLCLMRYTEYLCDCLVFLSDLWGADDTLSCTRLSDGRPRLWQHDRCSSLLPASGQQRARRLRRPLSEMLACIELRQWCRSRTRYSRSSRAAGYRPGDCQPVAVVMRPDHRRLIGIFHSSFVVEHRLLGSLGPLFEQLMQSPATL